MIKKSIILAIAYLLLVLVSISLNSCYGSKDGNVCDISVFAYLNKNNTDSVVVLSVSIYGYAYGETCLIPDAELVSSCYAWQKCIDFQNQLLPSTYELFLDKDIYFKGDTISAKTDLLKVSGFFTNINIDVIDDCDQIISNIEFGTEICKYIIFDDEEYQVFFSCSTSDGRNLLASTVLMNYY